MNVALRSLLNKLLIEVLTAQPVLAEPLCTNLPLMNDPRTEERHGAANRRSHKACPGGNRATEAVTGLDMKGTGNHNHFFARLYASCSSAWVSCKLGHCICSNRRSSI